MCFGYCRLQPNPRVLESDWGTFTWDSLRNFKDNWGGRGTTRRASVDPEMLEKLKLVTFNIFRADTAQIPPFLTQECSIILTTWILFLTLSHINTHEYGLIHVFWNCFLYIKNNMWLEIMSSPLGTIKWLKWPPLWGPFLEGTRYQCYTQKW